MGSVARLPLCHQGGVRPSELWRGTLAEETSLLRASWTLDIPASHTPYSWGWLDKDEGGDIPKSHTEYSYRNAKPSPRARRMGGEIKGDLR